LQQLARYLLIDYHDGYLKWRILLIKVICKCDLKNIYTNTGYLSQPLGQGLSSKLNMFDLVQKKTKQNKKVSELVSQVNGLILTLFVKLILEDFSQRSQLGPRQFYFDIETKFYNIIKLELA